MKEGRKRGEGGKKGRRNSEAVERSVSKSLWDLGQTFSSLGSISSIVK
jgi:hypothetical protein